MPLDKIVVLVLAIAFFGGLYFVYWKSRHTEEKGGPAAPESSGEATEKGPKEKKPRNVKA